MVFDWGEKNRLKLKVDKEYVGYLVAEEPPLILVSNQNRSEFYNQGPILALIFFWRRRSFLATFLEFRS